jgi:hypothetical protein
LIRLFYDGAATQTTTQRLLALYHHRESFQPHLPRSDGLLALASVHGGDVRPKGGTAEILSTSTSDQFEDDVRSAPGNDEFLIETGIEM